MLGNALGLRTVIVIPNTQSQEKKDTLRLLGAEVVEVPAVPYRDANNYVKYSARLAEALAATEPGGAVWANQFDNTANRDIHTATTAEEIWADTEGKVDGFVAAVGSGGTLGGVSRGLKAKREGIAIALADPPGSALYSYFTTGEFKAEGSSVTEGHRPEPHHQEPRGGGHRHGLSDPRRGDAAHRLRPHGRGGSVLSVPRRGVNVAGAMRLARELGPGHTIVTILCDSGTRYQSRLFNPAFLEGKSLPVPGWLARPAPPLPSVFSAT